MAGEESPTPVPGRVPDYERREHESDLEQYRERLVLLVRFTWDADGRPVGGTMEEEAIGQPDYYSRNLTLLDEDALTQTLAGYM